MMMNSISSMMGNMQGMNRPQGPPDALHQSMQSHISTDPVPGG